MPHRSSYSLQERDKKKIPRTTKSEGNQNLIDRDTPDDQIDILYAVILNRCYFNLSSQSSNQHLMNLIEQILDI